MKVLVNLFVIIGSAILMAGCATGPGYMQVKASFPPLAPDNGRIFFYRTAALGAAIQPTAKLNGSIVGVAKPGGFFFVDRPPGDYQVETTTEVTRRLSMILDKGQTRYVRFDVSMGFFIGHVYPVLVETPTGEKEIAECNYMNHPQ